MQHSCACVLTAHHSFPFSKSASAKQTKLAVACVIKSNIFEVSYFTAV